MSCTLREAITLRVASTQLLTDIRELQRGMSATGPMMQSFHTAVNTALMALATTSPSADIGNNILVIDRCRCRSGTFELTQ